MRSVYLAGPGVFRRDAADYGAALKRRCRKLGLEPLWPLDNVPTATGVAEIARQIREMNCAMIRRASAVIADISPFRGPNMDPGTAFEIGYAAALDKPIFLYTTSSSTLLERTTSYAETTDVSGKWRDALGMEIEDFGLAENLMIVGFQAEVFAGFDKALLATARELNNDLS